jgi:hypothetical protein
VDEPPPPEPWTTPLGGLFTTGGGGGLWATAGDDEVTLDATPGDGGAGEVFGRAAGFGRALSAGVGTWP